ncbi:STAS domain-containing protein [Bacillus pinisoli]|uniref:STAS domain-containing protein n=1 Tax=Bacillus pinisoli TaxID=2901866 RepID=UPI001FF1B8BF
MKVEIALINGVVHVSLGGKMYVQEAMKLREEISAYVEKGYKDFDFDLGALEYIDSTGLGVLIGLQKQAVSNNGNLTVRGLKGPVKEIFYLTRLNLVFKIQ